MESKGLGPVFQSIISLTSPLVVKMLTVLVGTISNSQVFLLKKMRVAFQATRIFFSKNISVNRSKIKKKGLVNVNAFLLQQTLFERDLMCRKANRSHKSCLSRKTIERRVMKFM